MRFSHALTLGVLLCGIVMNSVRAPGLGKKGSIGWQKVKILVQGGHAIQAVREAKELIRSHPSDSSLPVVFSRSFLAFARRHIPKGQRAKVEKELGDMVQVIWQAYESKPHPGVARNFVKITYALWLHGFLREEMRSEKYKDRIYLVSQNEKAGPELFIPLAAFYLEIYNRDYSFSDMLMRAEATAFKAENPREVLIRVSDARARLAIQRANPMEALMDLHRIVQLDEDFGYRSNWALARLGAIALSQGKAEEAKTFLALARRVRPGHALKSSG